MKVIHVSWLKRHDQGAGGVERFALYLQRAMAETGHECAIYSWSDYPGAAQCDNVANPDKARLLGAWLESAVKFDIAIVDGYWGLGITHHPIVTTIHGTWAAFTQAMGMSSGANPEVHAQHEAFNALNAFPVAVSPASAREVKRFHRREVFATINNAVDLEEFYPLKEGRLDTAPIVLQAAGNNRKKGADIIPQIARHLGPSFQVIYLAAQPGEEARSWQRGDIFLHPAKHEGNAYSLLEAMATGLPVVTSAVGMFEDVPDQLVGRVLPPSATTLQWAEAVREVWGDGVTPYRKFALKARQVAEAIADFEGWKRQWDRCLVKILAGEHY